MGLLISWLTAAVGLWLAAQLVDGFEIREFKGAAVVAIVFGLIYFFVGYAVTAVIAVGTLGLPFFLGLGFLVRWFVTAVVLKVTDALMDTLTIRGWAPAFWGAAIMALVGAARDWLL